MNEVKKSLDALSEITTEDLEEVKQRVLSGKQRPKKRNPIPAAVTALVSAAVLFFAFNVLKDGLSTADVEEYEVNELIYEFILHTVSEGNEDEAPPETKQEVLQSILQTDALLDYAESLGYKEDKAAIEEIVAEQRDGYYAELDKEGEERKNQILQQQEKSMGISYDEYFNVIYKRTTQYEKAYEWLTRHPQDNSKTMGEVIGLFKNKHERTITDFMEQKTIPPFNLTVRYEDLSGTVANVEDDRVLVTYRFKEDAATSVDELIEQKAASYFVIDDSLEEIKPGMEIRVIYDPLSYVIGSKENLTVFREVKEWEKIGSNTEPEFLAKNEGRLSDADIETAFEMCVRALTDYYKAVWNGTDIDLDAYIENENLNQYMQKKIQSQHDRYGGFNDPVKNIEIGDWEAEFTDNADGGFLYLHLPVAINKYQGGYGEATEFLVRNVNGKLVIVDWYTGAKDSYDFMVRGENETIDDPDIWNDDEWVKKLDGTPD